MFKHIPNNMCYSLFWKLLHHLLCLKTTFVFIQMKSHQLNSGVTIAVEFSP